MIWGCKKMILGNDEVVWLKVGKIIIFKFKVIIFWFVLSINSILSDIKKIYFFFNLCNKMFFFLKSLWFYKIILK